MRIITYNEQRYETTIIPQTLLKYYKKFGWEPVRSTKRNDEWEYGSTPLRNETNFDQREIFNESLEWRMKQDLSDKYRQVHHTMIKRHRIYSEEVQLNDLFASFKYHYRIAIRAEKRYYHRFLLGIVSFLLFLIFLFGAFICLSFAAYNVDPVDEEGYSLGVLSNVTIVEAQDEESSDFTLGTPAGNIMNFIKPGYEPVAPGEEGALPEDPVFIALTAIFLILAVVMLFYFCFVCCSNRRRKIHKKAVLETTYNASQIVRDIQYANPQLMNPRQRSRYLQGKVYSAAILNAEDADNMLFF